MEPKRRTPSVHQLAIANGAVGGRKDSPLMTVGSCQRSCDISILSDRMPAFGLAIRLQKLFYNPEIVLRRGLRIMQTVRQLGKSRIDNHI